MKIEIDVTPDMIDDIVGEVEPIGETNTDRIRLANLQKLSEVIDLLLDKVDQVIACDGAYQSSIKTAVSLAKNIKEHVRDHTDDGRYEELYWIADNAVSKNPTSIDSQLVEYFRNNPTP
ncbi:hypothetical protein NVP1170O_032 [Vibrio phage 1.170.O._10N.261.52.C3]|nr:hypothetical protein NVP1170O_032 [Vibrio phage 1.170.O._10N.261.52.C3]